MVIVFTKELQMRLVSLVVVALVAYLMGMQKGIDMVDQDAQEYAEFYCNERMPSAQGFLNGSLNASEYYDGSRYLGYQNPGWVPT